MPLIEKSKYKRPVYFFSTHLETIIPSISNKIRGVNYQREKLTLADDDFVNLDWIKKDNKRLVILSAGMEGHSGRNYMLRSAKYFDRKGWDVLAWNYRSCGGEINNLPKSYYYGGIEDYSEVIDHALAANQYEQIILIGFSMGGCLVNKFLGSTENPDPRIKGAVSFSVSCDLWDSVNQLKVPFFNLYNYVFTGHLKDKLKKKVKIFDEYKKIEVASFSDFLKQYSLPFHNLESSEDFYYRSSCKNYFDGITIPSLIVNAKNDPILAGDCYPYDQVNDLENVYLEAPDHGGHLGFTIPGKEFSWMEIRANEFIREHILEGGVK